MMGSTIQQGARFIAPCQAYQFVVLRFAALLVSIHCLTDKEDCVRKISHG